MCVCVLCVCVCVVCVRVRACVRVCAKIIRIYPTELLIAMLSCLNKTDYEFNMAPMYIPHTTMLYVILNTC